MPNSIDQAFIKQFQAEVHEAYQRQGSKLRNTLRTVNNVKGSSTTFQKVGKGTASKKTRNGKVPVMNLEHTNVECVLEDFYAGDWVDKLDELKTNIDERQIVASAGAYALGRKTDSLIISQFETTTNTIIANLSGSSEGMTIGKVMAAFEDLGNNDVPEDGERYAVVGWKQWSELLQIDDFVNADYVGPDALPFNAMTQAKRWLGTLWMPHSGLPLSSGDIRSCFWYHKTAVGHASGADIQTDISWHGDHASHFVNNMMSQGAKMIDDSAVIEILCDESP